MVEVINYHLRKSKEGKEFISLELQGDIETVQSMETARFYITVRRCKILCTFNEEKAKSILGTKMPGRIVRVACDEFEYTIPETGEVVKLAHTYQYEPEEYSPQVAPSRVVVAEKVKS